jgi:hypothetical protein
MASEKQLTRRQFLQTAPAITWVSASEVPSCARVAAQKPIILENDDVRYVVGADGRNRTFMDKQNGRDYCVRGPEYTFLSIGMGGKTYQPSACSFSNGELTVEFQQAGVRVVSVVTTRPHYFTIEVKAVEGEGVEQLTLSNLRLDISEHVGTLANVAWDNRFAACIMALNLHTNAGGKSVDQALLGSACYRKFGLVGAKIGIVGCPAQKLRSVIKEMVLRDGFVHSDVGGAWALDAEENRYSYLFAYASEADADAWIAMARSGGFQQILVSGIGPYGHYNPYPQKFPHGLAGVQSVVDKIHAAGMKAGLHMLAFTIQKNDPWVSPVPDKHLATGRTLTLASPIAPGAIFLPTVESPQGLPIHSGFWFRGGMDIMVGDEILVYTGLQTSPPYGLGGCKRGAYGTSAATHAKGSALRNLKEVFGTYVPEADSTLMDEMEQRIAYIVDACGFDMIYFDGLDGADVFAGSAWSWYYGPQFALSVFRRVKRRLQVEASAWYHHDWHITSRLGAWDHTVRAPKKFLDLHIASNDKLNDLLPTQLGWWAFNNYKGLLGLATTPDVIEYLGCKCLGRESAFSLQGITPKALRKDEEWSGLLATLGEYETLRLGHEVSESIKTRLRVPGDEFTLRKRCDGKWQFLPVEYYEHKVASLDNASNVIKVTNRFPTQRPGFRIQGLMAAAPYDAAQNLVLANFSHPATFERRSAQSGVTIWLGKSGSQVKGGEMSGFLWASSCRSSRPGAWARVGKRFSPPFNMADHPALGVWVYGDGKGEVLNFQLLDLRGATAAAGEHYVIVDFKGWRYFELVEPEGKRWSDYVWPYDNPLAVWREAVDDSHVVELNIYYNNVPSHDNVACKLSPLKALPVKKVKLERPRLTVAAKTITFPVALESGCYLEIRPPADCKLFDPNGCFIQEVKPKGELPMVEAGENQIVFNCDTPGGFNARAIVTTILSGPPLTD